jgi:hypothetical protein
MPLIAVSARDNSWRLIIMSKRYNGRIFTGNAVPSVSSTSRTLRLHQMVYLQECDPSTMNARTYISPYITMQTSSYVLYQLRGSGHDDLSEFDSFIHVIFGQMELYTVNGPVVIHR